MSSIFTRLPLNATEVAGPMLAGDGRCGCCLTPVYRGRLAIFGGLCELCYGSREADRDHGNREPSHWLADECPANCVAGHYGDAEDMPGCYCEIARADDRRLAALFVCSIESVAARAASGREGNPMSKTVTRDAAAETARKSKHAAAERARRAAKRSEDTYSCALCGARGLSTANAHACPVASDQELIETIAAESDPTEPYPCPMPGCIAVLTLGVEHDCPLLAESAEGFPAGDIDEAFAAAFPDVAADGSVTIETTGEKVLAAAASNRRAGARETRRQNAERKRELAAEAAVAETAERVLARTSDAAVTVLRSRPDPTARNERLAAALALAIADVKRGAVSVRGSVKGDTTRWHIELSDARVPCGRGISIPTAERERADLSAATCKWCAPLLKATR